MDMEQEEMQFLGILDIYIEAYKIIYKWRKIFMQITLTLILPLSFIYLAHLEISHQISSRIRHTKFQLRYTRTGTPRYEKLADYISSETAILWLFRVVYFTFLMIFSLLSTSAVVYTIASIYTSREVTFKKIVSVVPKVWKRLMVTFLCIFLAFVAYNVIATLIIILWGVTLVDTQAEAISLIIILVLYAIGFVYMTIIWHLASIVTVLEDSYGFKAMMKSKELIKGKIWVAVIIFFLVNLSIFAVTILFKIYVVYHERSTRILQRIGLGGLFLVMLLTFILFNLVVQTILYFVCKSYHHENIDKSSLSDHLEVYLGEYVPLKSRDVQLEQYRV